MTSCFFSLFCTTIFRLSEAKMICLNEHRGMIGMILIIWNHISGEWYDFQHQGVEYSYICMYILKMKAEQKIPWRQWKNTMSDSSEVWTLRRSINRICLKNVIEICWLRKFVSTYVCMHVCIRESIKANVMSK